MLKHVQCNRGLWGYCKPHSAGPRQYPSGSLGKVPENVRVLAYVLLTKRVKQLC